MSNCFNDFFVNIGNSVEAKIPRVYTPFNTFLKHKNNDTFFIKPVDENEIKGMISNLFSSKACGPNSIPTHILKLNLDFLTMPLKHVINLSFSEGCFPQMLKLADICPIFKKKDKNRCENYRPISLLSNLSKLFERAMHTRIYEFLEQCNIFSDLQFGFRKKHSTNHALLYTNLLCSDKSEKIFKMDEDLKLIYIWLCANRLSLNVDKTEFLVFRPPRKKLENLLP